MTTARTLIQTPLAPNPHHRRQLRVVCSPLSSFERRLSRIRSELDGGEGWLRACAAGTGGAGPPAAPDGGGGALAIAPAASGTADGGGGSGSGGGGGTAAGGCPEYAARLAEAVYSCADHALRFLALTSPQMEAKEAAEAGAMWPKKAVLVALQDQGLALAQAQLMGGGAAAPRRRRLAAAGLRLVQGAAPFVQLLGGRAAGAEERVAEKVAQLERALGEAAAGGGGGGALGSGSFGKR